MTLHLRNVVSPLIAAIVETDDPQNAGQYDFFKVVKPGTLIRGILQEYPSVNDPLNMMPSAYLQHFGYYLGLFDGPTLEFLHDSGIATNVWESGFKRISSVGPTFPYVTDPAGMFQVKKSTWKGPLNFTSTFWTNEIIGAHTAWKQGYTGKGVTAVVVDTGGSNISNAMTRRLRKQTAVDQNFADAIGHGSWCAAAVGGVRAVDNYYSQSQGKQVVCEGVAPECTLGEIKALDFGIGTGTDAQLLLGLEKAISFNPPRSTSILGVDVLSCSWGGSSSAKTPEDSVFFKPYDILTRGGVIICTASGNSGSQPNTIDEPGTLPQALTVGAYNAIDNSNLSSFGPGGQVAVFSSRGPTAWGDIKPDVVAPGAIIDNAMGAMWMSASYELQPHGFVAIAGSSMSTPICAGLIALMQQAYRALLPGQSLTTDEVKSMMATTGLDYWDLDSKDNNIGWGAINWDIFTQYMGEKYGFDVATGKPIPIPTPSSS